MGRKIKLRKLKDQIARADITTDYIAVTDVANQIKAYKRKIKANSVVSKSFDLAALRKRQAKIRTLIDKEPNEMWDDALVLPSVVPELDIEDECLDVPLHEKLETLLTTSFKEPKPKK